MQDEDGLQNEGSRRTPPLGRKSDADMNHTGERHGRLLNCADQAPSNSFSTTKLPSTKTLDAALGEGLDTT